MNIHLARGGESAGPVLFPSSPEELPDHRYARLLWDISSEMPESYNDMIRSMKNGSHALSEKGSSTPFRAVGWGSHIGGVAAMMNIGSINSMML